MKRFLFMFLVVPLLLLAGCKDKSPEFKLDLTGTVVETTTHITTDFKVATTNVANTYFEYGALAFPRLTQVRYPDAYKWVKDKALSNVSNGALYDITAIGYVEWYGVKLSVDEHWCNKNALALNSANVDYATPFIYLPQQKRYFANYVCKSEYKARFDYVGY